MVLTVHGHPGGVSPHRGAVGEEVDLEEVAVDLPVVSGPADSSPALHAGELDLLYVAPEGASRASITSAAKFATFRKPLASPTACSTIASRSMLTIPRALS